MYTNKCKKKIPWETVRTKARQEGGFPQMWMGFFLSAEAVILVAAGNTSCGESKIFALWEQLWWPE